MPSVIDLTGARFGHLTVQRRTANQMNRIMWLCLCDCGKETVAASGNLRKGDWKSCGCRKSEFSRKAATVHGERFSDEYRIWSGMLTRCNNKNHHKYHRYGGRGIAVCRRWAKSFETFLADMDRRPSPLHSLDRFPNNDGDYEPGNCRWATREQQNATKGNRIRVTVAGKQMFLDVAAKKLGISYSTAYSRYRQGRPVDVAVTAERWSEIAANANKARWARSP